MVSVKICGMTNLEDCKKAVDLSVNFVGFVFYEKSPRYVAPSAARKIIEKLGGNVKTVGVFVDQSDGAIQDAMDYCRLTYAQVYRDVPVPNRIRVVRIGASLPGEPLDDEGLILFDSYSEGYGGSGKSFDFRVLRDFKGLDRAFVAGGVSIDNVDDILRLKPFGIDLVSSIEKEKGKKDHRKMEKFMTKVRSFVL